MGYSYGLFKVSDASVDRLNKVDYESAKPIGYSLYEAKEEISRVVPLIDWDGEYGQIIHPNWGRFECSISTEYGPHQAPMVLFTTSLHVDYQSKMIEVARLLDLSVFDGQTGERIYEQKNYQKLDIQPSGATD